MLSLPVQQSKIMVTSLHTVQKFKDNMVEKAVKELKCLSNLRTG